MFQFFRTWESPRFTKMDIYAILISLFFSGIVRAWSYIEREDGADVLYLVEKTMALAWWGYLLYITLGVLFLGLLFSNHVLIWSGHALTGLVYFVLLLGIILTWIFNDTPLYQGIVYSSLLLTPLVLHIIFSVRMGARPLDDLHPTPVETVAGENGQ